MVEVSQIITLVKGIPKNESIIPGLYISNVKPIEKADTDSVVWVASYLKNKEETITQTKARVIICSPDLFTDEYEKLDKVFILVDNPKLAITQVIKQFFIKKELPFISKSARISQEAKIGKNVTLHENVSIGRSIIGDNTTIQSNTIIFDNVEIGSNCFIGANAIIGGDGFNYAKSNDGALIDFPHLGNVIIEDNVTVKAGSYIAQGVLGETRISAGTKIAQHVYIGSNVIIGKNCSLRPKVNLCGSVVIEDNVTIGSSAAVKESVRAGKNCFIGMGAVVVKDLEEGKTYVGNPAIELK